MKKQEHRGKGRKKREGEEELWQLRAHAWKGKMPSKRQRV